jgi:EAL domain-containing protein (putative c-di-GMP-specific phosphodiesterase class I)
VTSRIARAIIAFGSALGLKVIAEGVESHDQFDILRGCGCDELQGYLFSRPIPAEDARKLVTERRHLPLART